MIEYSTMKKVFATAAELREDYIAMREAYGMDDSGVWEAGARFNGAIDIIQAIGGAELEDEFYEWCKEKKKV